MLWFAGNAVGRFHKFKYDISLEFCLFKLRVNCTLLDLHCVSKRPFFCNNSVKNGQTFYTLGSRIILRNFGVITNLPHIWKNVSPHNFVKCLNNTCVYILPRDFHTSQRNVVTAVYRRGGQMCRLSCQYPEYFCNKIRLLSQLVCDRDINIKRTVFLRRSV